MTTKQHIVDQLNKLLCIDRQLIEQLINGNYQPVSCAYQNADEFLWDYDNELTAVAGFLGVLNGLLKHDDYYIAANFTDDDTDDAMTKQLLGFSLIESNKVFSNSKLGKKLGRNK